MRTLKIVGTVALLTVMAMAQVRRTMSAADVLSTVQGKKSLGLFGTAVRLGGMTETLRGVGPFTVIAPADGAFAGLPKDDMRKLMTSPVAMNALLAHYIVHGKIASNDAAGLSSARTLMGATLRADDHNGNLRVNGARIVEGDIRCVNGVVHIVDRFDPGLVREAVAMAGPSHPLM
jgi:uncharacterized surface protein with fasciclin (FAS1) repeats